MQQVLAVWVSSIIICLVVVYSGTFFYGLVSLKPLLTPIYGVEVYAYGYGSFAILLHWSSFISSVICILVCGFLSRVMRSTSRLIGAGFILFFVANIYSCFIVIWPNYAADFGATWQMHGVVFLLILGRDYVLPFFVVISLFGGIALGFINNLKVKGRG